jgi:hypothetical protein
LEAAERLLKCKNEYDKFISSSRAAIMEREEEYYF